MKKLIALVLVCSMLTLSLGACGSSMNINGKEYDTQGLLTDKNPRIEYKIIWGNVFWGVVLCETIIAPIYFFGFSIFEPVGVKSDRPIDPADIGTMGRKDRI